jgi:hypothetical protein
MHRHSLPEDLNMASKNTAVFGIYRTPADAERAVDALMGNGFSSGAISVLLPDNESTRAFAHHKDTKAPEGTTAGATTGGVIGGALGVLVGIGALAIPGVGPLIAAGPIVAGLAGLGVGGAVGGLVGALIGMGIPEYEAKRYEGRVKDGGTLLSVHCDTSDQVSRAKDLLKSSGAQDISSTSQQPHRASRVSLRIRRLRVWRRPRTPRRQPRLAKSAQGASPASRRSTRSTRRRRVSIAKRKLITPG